MLFAGPLLSTRPREDRHANARRPLAGSGSAAAAARVEPSPEGLAQVHTAARANTLDEFLCDGYLHRWKYILPIASRSRVAGIS